MATIKEGAEDLRHLVKRGVVQIDALKIAARVGKESEVALKMLEKDGFKI